VSCCWRWRYTYLIFGLGTIVITSQGLLGGTYWPLLLAIGPHLLALPAVAWTYFLGPIPGIDELCITLGERGYDERRQFVREFLFTSVCTQRGVSAKSR
jgi:hypothetical protein